MGSNFSRGALACLGGVAAAALVVETVGASNVAAGLGDAREFAIPTWLVVATGGAAVGASGLLTALVTDRSFVETLHEWSRPLWSPTKAASRIGAVVGVLALVTVLVVGFDGPSNPTANLAVLLAFVGLRGLLPIIAYALVDPWPTIDPFRTVAAAAARVASFGGRGRSIGRRERSGESNGVGESDERGLFAYPAPLRSWPAVFGLAGLVWLELVLPVTVDARTLAAFVTVYTVYTVCGAILFSPAIWFRRVDPLAALFRLYGAVAPIQRTGRDGGGGLSLVLPGSRLRRADVVRDSSEVALVLVLVWELTFNGLVVTPPGASAVERLVATGLPPAGAYLLLLVAGYGAFYGAFRLATLLARRSAPTYLTERVLARRFAPPLVAIAAGYHFAHYVAFVVSLSPATLAALGDPLSPPVNPTVLAIPGWVSGLEMAALLVGHLLAIWVAHAISFELFPGRLQAIRSQYPFVAVMICYTALSLWLLSLPTTVPPFVDG